MLRLPRGRLGERDAEYVEENRVHREVGCIGVLNSLPITSYASRIRLTSALILAELIRKVLVLIHSTKHIEKSCPFLSHFRPLV